MRPFFLGGGGGEGALERQRRRRLRKRDLQSKASHAASGFKLYRSSFMSCNSSNVFNIFYSWILTDCNKVQEKKKKVAVLRSDPPQNVKLGIFASLGSRAVMTRKVQKSVMHVQSCCFANLNLLLSWCSRWRRRRRCLCALIAIDYSSRTSFQLYSKKAKLFTHLPVRDMNKERWSLMEVPRPLGRRTWQL